MKLRNLSDDELLAELERRDVFERHHIYEVGKSSIAVQHPIRCRMHGKALLDCEAGKVALSLTEPPAPPGRRYTAALEDGRLVAWTPIGETP